MRSHHLEWSRIIELWLPLRPCLPLLPVFAQRTNVNCDAGQLDAERHPPHRRHQRKWRAADLPDDADLATSRMSSRRVCHTEAEWREIAAPPTELGSPEQQDRLAFVAGLLAGPKPSFSATRIDGALAALMMARLRPAHGPHRSTRARPGPPRWRSPARSPRRRTASPFRASSSIDGLMPRLKSAKPSWPIMRAVGAALDRPIAPAEDAPAGRAAEQFAPRILARQALAADVAHDARDRPSSPPGRRRRRRGTAGGRAARSPGREPRRDAHLTSCRG